MTSHKEEPNPSILFGDSAGDDPFSQIQQQNTAVSEVPAKEVIEEKKIATTANEQTQKVVGDASSLFGGAGNTNNAGGNADLFFSSAANQQTANQPLTSNTSAASFFEQPNLSQNPSESFFDGLGQPGVSSTTQAFSNNQQQQQPAAAASLTQAYDPNTYSSYDYSQQTQQHEQASTGIYNQQDQQDQQQQYDQSQWIQFDPNVHYYYDEQGQVHYYDPNTNQEYDMSQYEYDQTGQTYDYQYDPQYAEYYAQQGYDTSAYAATTETNTTGEVAATVPDSQQQQAYAQENYDPNAYAPQQLVTAHPPPSSATAATADQGYYNPNEYAPVNTASSSHAQPEEVQPAQQQQNYDYHPQAYAPVNNAVAEVPAQIQSEQTIDTQHYSSQQQDEYGVQNYTPADASTEAVHHQYDQTQQEYNYQGYEATDLQQQQYAPVVENNYVPDNSFTPVSQDYSQTDFFGEDLQQRQAPPKSFAPPPMASAPPRAKSVVSPPPRQAAIPPPPKATAPPQQQAVVPSSTPSSHRGSYDASVPVQEAQPKEVDLDDLDDLVLGGSVKGNNQKPVDEFDLLMNTSDYDSYNKEATEPVYTNPNQYEEKPAHEEETPISLTTAPTTDVVLAPSEEHKQNETAAVPQEQPAKDFETFYSSYEPQQPAAETFVSYEPQPAEEQPVESSYTTSYEPQQAQEHVESYGAYDAQQYEQQQQPAETYSSYEPQQAEQAVDYSSYAPQQGEQVVDYSSYEPQQVNQSVDYSSYEPQQADQTANYSSYEPRATSYEPQQQEPYYNNYEHQAPAVETAAPVTAYEAPKQYVASPPPSRNVVSLPPPQRGNMISPPPPGVMQAFSQQRSNSITEPDRKQNGSPFTGYYGQFPIGRSATVPPPITERIASPRPALIACPDPQCEGENKAKAKFCCECGRPLAGISRSTTPSASLSPGAFSMNEISSSFAPVVEQPRTALDDKKDAMIQSLKTFNNFSVLVNADSAEKQKLALDYIDSRMGEFESSKALLWHIVKLMIQHQDGVLGDGGELDKSIVALLSTQPTESSTTLDKLENYLAQGDREGACQFAVENDMWAHALIISQSNNTDQFKRVISQFIDRELFSSSTELIPQVPGDKKSLRMLYSVFSGAGADAVVELARNSPEEYPTCYSKESLEAWKNALALILANRSSKDREAITGLGDQLKQVGSLDDAYICYILSPDIFIESGLESHIVGAEGTDIYTDLDALYITELYEYALSSKSLTLQNYKLIHAWWLSEFGFTTESQIYCDSIVNAISSSDALQGLKQIDQVCDTTLSENVTSLLNKTTFDTLIGSIETKSSQNSYQGTSYGDDSNGYVPAHGQEAAASDVNNYNYGYGYGGSYTETGDNNGGYQPTTEASTPFRQGIQSPFQQAKGIQSPFQKSASIPQKSPFQSNVQPVSSPFGVPAPAAGGVRSPFQHSGGYAQPSTTDSGSWWGSEEQTTTGEVAFDEQSNDYQPYQSETPANYQPDSYAPAPAAATTDSGAKSSSAVWDNDDDDLGFGNSKKKPATEDTKDNKDDSVREEKPNEITSNDKKEQEKGSGGWGIFSLFSRKEKEQNLDEKKAVKANLGEQSSFYYDEKEKRWVNKLNDSKPATAATPPPPKASTPQPSMGSSMPPMGSPMAPPAGGLKPSSMPPTRINSTPNVPGATSGGPPSAAPPAFNTPPASRRGAGKKPMRSRYVDVLNTN